ncbi:hypothetical protein [Mangrovimonas sp. DI 80]|uniref:hypothetical protein n=1 Tax=Mangrovimonas sp. DI 80 TaxID=1779330 RepID=UPI000976B43F|nr:hypothetical protein [Mangrovimonas sp. DI 80]OMP30370.1 hypothetical protein BKM32_13390 [Mangrovimonas sp. DI 80]
MRRIAILLLLAVFCSCGQQPKEAMVETEVPVKYDMYVPSEMANLMNEMYNYKAELKQDILSGTMPTEFPNQFLKIHSAELSDFKDRTEAFEAMSKAFIEAEQRLYDSTSTQSLETRFNATVNLCISCHNMGCTGPIPRIQKLLIN